MMRSRERRKMSGGVMGVAAFALMLAACTDGTGPQNQGATVRIYLGGTPYDELTISVGSSIALEGRVLDAKGNTISGETVQWLSDRTDVATVTVAGVVTGVAEGAANIIARHRLGEDTARVTVASPITGPVTACTADEATSYALGETRVLSGAEALRLCLPGSADYSLVVVNGGSTAAASLATRVTATGVRSPLGGPTPALVPAAITPGAPAPVADAEFHRHLREDVSARLEGRLRSGINVADLAPPRLQAAVGQVLSYNVESSSADGCGNPKIRGVRIRAITDHAIVAADTLNPAGGFSDADFEAFGKFFDDQVWPMDTGAFGEPTDIDKNGKVIILFTRGVNERPENSPGNNTSYVGGFYYNRDLFPKSGTGACAGSNVAEMFYMLVPDPTGAVQGRAFSRDFVLQHTRSVLGHEFQHLINDSRRLYVNKAVVWEETWLNEGLSHIAEELMFYRMSNLSPGRNLKASDFQGNPARRDLYAEFQLSNFDRLAAYLRRIDSSSLMGPDLLETRGAAWLFLRYAADRRGGDENTLWRKLSGDTRSAGLQNLTEALGSDPREWIRDWLGAIYIDDTGFDTDTRYRLPSWNFRDLFPAAGNLWPGTFYATYPLSTSTVPTDRVTGIQGGTAMYLRTGVTSGNRATIRFTVGDLPPPSRLKVIVTRTR